MEPQLEGCGKGNASAIVSLLPGLQWSRNLRVAESAGASAGAAVAKMLQWSRNLRVAESSRAASRLRARLKGFNGAAT